MLRIILRFSCIIAFLTLASCGRQKVTEQADALNCAPGIWVNAQVGRERWNRYELKPDGTFRMWEQPPTADNWGQSRTTGKWKVAAGKYSDTGTRWVGLDFSYDLGADGRADTIENMAEIGARRVFRDCDTLEFSNFSDHPVAGIKGDQNPFH